MTNLFNVSCNGIQDHLMREVGRLQKSLLRLVASADPTALVRQLEEDAASDLASLGSQYARAQAMGLDSDFTLGLMDASLKLVLHEIGGFVPEVRSITDKMQAFTQTSFSMIQILIQLTDNSPLVMAAKAKTAIESFLSERKARLEKILLQAESLAEQWVQLATDVPSIGKAYQKIHQDVLVHIKEVERKVLLFRTSLKKSNFQSIYLTHADESLKKAIHTLSPEQAQLGEPSTVQAQDVIDLLLGGYDQTEIQSAMRRAEGIHQFAVDDETIASLADAGANEETLATYRRVGQSTQKKGTTEKRLQQLTVGVMLLENDVEELTLLETKMLQAMEHYAGILAALDNPKAVEEALLSWYLRSSEVIEKNIKQLRLEMENNKSLQKGAREGWVIRMASLRATLSFLQRSYAQDRKDKMNQADGIYFDRYKESLRAMAASQHQWQDAVNRTSGLTSEVVLNVIRKWASAIRSDIERQDTEAALSLPYAKTLRATLVPLRAIQKEIVSRERDYLQCLSIYTPTPPTPALFATIEKLMTSLGLDRMRDMFSLGDLPGLMQANPLTATYGGAAMECLIKLRDAAESDAERAKFEKALVFVSKEERRKQFGKTQINIRSLRAIDAIKAQIETWQGIARTLFSQIPTSWDDPRNPVHAAHASMAQVGQSIQEKGTAIAATVQKATGVIA